MKNVHLIAACGVGMASLAGMLKEKGCRVTGSDANVYPPMSTQLESLGIRLASPYAAENIPPDADLVVVGNAVSRGNPEAQEAVRRGVPTLSMPQAVARFFIGDRESIVVAGTHGKTTTTSLAAWSLFALGADPSFLVGGVPKNFPVSYRLGEGRHFVIEGDEYDTAYFDKGPKFLHYRPRIVLLTSVEFDHADIYRDLDHVRESFRKLAAILPPDGLLVACADYPDVVAVAREARCPVIFYATRDGALPAGSGFGAWAVRGTGESGGMTGFRMEGAGRALDFRFPLPGLHNAANAAGVAIVLMRLGFLPEAIARTFERFAGIRRRQEVVGEFRGILVVDDFAHHPTAVRETIRAVRGRYPGRRIVAVFEPRSNTSRRKVFQREFTAALSEADEVILAGVFGAEKIPPEERLSPEEVAAELRAAGHPAQVIPEVDGIVSRLAETCRTGDLVLIMSNGGFGGIQEKLTDRPLTVFLTESSPSVRFWRMRTIPGRHVARAVLGAVLLLSCVLASPVPASAAGYSRRIAIAPFASLTKEDIGATVSVLPRLLASRLMALAGADVVLLPAGGKAPEAAAKEAKVPLLLQGTVSKLGKGYSVDTIGDRPRDRQAGGGVLRRRGDRGRHHRATGRPLGRDRREAVRRAGGDPGHGPSGSRRGPVRFRRVPGAVRDPVDRRPGRRRRPRPPLPFPYRHARRGMDPVFRKEGWPVRQDRRRARTASSRVTSMPTETERSSPGAGARSTSTG